MSEATLYERLGGEENIRKIATTLFDTHANNKTINARYINSDRDKVIQLVFEFLCNATGGPQEYTGRDMLTTHKGMNISEEEFMAVLDDILEALQLNDVGQREQEELLLANYNLRGDIVRV
jgi:hemoglobin